MKLFVVARIMNGEQACGYRLLDVDNNYDLKDISLPAIIKTLSNPTYANIIVNARLINGEIVGTNGQLSRYADIDSANNLLDKNKSPLVILNRIGDAGYTISDYKGSIKKAKTSDVIEYARKFGIANGKIVNQDGTEIISAITGTYETVELQDREKGDKINLNLNGNKTNIAREAAQDVEVELQYSDSLNSLTDEQVSIIKQFYMWYTVSEFDRMSNGTRFNVPREKLNKLAVLRGIDEWKFAGIYDTIKDHRKAKCELGHPLRYEYYAIPVDEAEKLGIGTKRLNYHRITSKGRNGYIEELRNHGAIVFGEICASDFFEIDPEDMKRLVKIRKDMSQEIDIMSQVASNKLEAVAWNNIKTLMDCLKELNDPKRVLDVFGEELGMLIMSFVKTNVPFPKSLVLLAANELRNNREKFLNYITENKCTDLVKFVSKGGDTKLGRQFSYYVRKMYNFFFDFTIEGTYMYDPIRDQEKSRRDIGGYNKKTRDERMLIEGDLSRYMNVNVEKDMTLENIRDFLLYIQRGIDADIELNNIVKGTPSNDIKFAVDLIKSGDSYRISTLDNINTYGISVGKDYTGSKMKLEVKDFMKEYPLVGLLCVAADGYDYIRNVTFTYKCYLKDGNTKNSLELVDTDVLDRVAIENRRASQYKLGDTIKNTMSLANKDYVMNVLRLLNDYIANYEQKKQEEINKDTNIYKCQLSVYYEFDSIVKGLPCASRTTGYSNAPIRRYLVKELNRRELEDIKKAILKGTDELISFGEGFIEIPAKAFQSIKETDNYDLYLERFNRIKADILAKEKADEELKQREAKEAEERALREKEEAERKAKEAELNKLSLEDMIEKQAQESLVDMDANKLYFGFEQSKLNGEETAQMIDNKKRFKETQDMLKKSNETTVDTNMLKNVLGFSDEEVEKALQKKANREKELADTLRNVMKSSMEIISEALKRDEAKQNNTENNSITSVETAAKEEKAPTDKIMADLKRLLEANSDKSSYKINIAEDIVSRGIAYDKLSYKQKSIVNTVLIELNGGKEIDGIKPAVTRELSSDKELQDKIDAIEKALAKKDMNITKEIGEASSIIDGVIKYVKRNNTCSEKQMKHIDKAYEVAKKYV